MSGEVDSTRSVTPLRQAPDARDQLHKLCDAVRDAVRSIEQGRTQEGVDMLRTYVECPPPPRGDPGRRKKPNT